LKTKLNANSKKEKDKKIILKKNRIPPSFLLLSEHDSPSFLEVRIYYGEPRRWRSFLMTNS
jgi:hypothetical protein